MRTAQVSQRVKYAGSSEPTCPVVPMVHLIELAEGANRRAQSVTTAIYN